MSRASLLFLTASGVFVAAAIVIGLLTVPPPSVQRAIDLDNARIRTLIAIAGAVATYHRANARLPASLSALPDAASLRLADLTTGAACEYIVNDSRTFQLCAGFAAASTLAVRSSPPEVSGWKHEVGRNCFSLTVPAGATPG